MASYIMNVSQALRAQGIRRTNASGLCVCPRAKHGSFRARRAVKVWDKSGWSGMVIECSRVSI